MQIDNQYDIIVVGGGISGSMAAIAAGRDGANVLLVEQYGFLGGMLTAAGVGPMMTFHAGEKQIVKGITGELIDRLKAKGKSPGHLYDTTTYTYTLTPFDAEGMKHELDLMSREAGVEVLFHTMLAKVNVSADTIESIDVCNKAGLTNLRAKVYIDATGDADLAVWAGVLCDKGRQEDGKNQPATMKFKMANVDTQKIRDYIKENIQDFPTLIDPSSIDRGDRLSIGGFLSIVKEAKEKGEFTLNRPSILIFETNTPGEFIINTSRIFGVDSTYPQSLSKAEMVGRDQVAELEMFLKKWVPGFENARLISSGPNIGIRSSRQIKGLYTLTSEDILSFKKFDDAITYCGYPIDIHPIVGEEPVDYSVIFRDGKYYSIPYGCLVNDKILNLVVVGRCISASFEAQAAIRTTPTMGAVGHAGGLAASLAASQNVPAKDIDILCLRQKLQEQNAFVE